VMHGGYDRERDRGWTTVDWFAARGACGDVTASACSR
jgi:hypothetical protein